MKNLIWVLAVLFVTVMPASAQVEVTVESGVVDTLKIWHPGFTAMCSNIALKLGAPEGTEAIRLQPKSLPPSRARYRGDVWVASIDRTERRIEIPVSDLPSVLSGIRGDATRSIFTARCNLKDNYFYSTEDMVFVLTNRADAEILRNSIR